ncbi:MAG: ATP-binding cassette domain-containing protein [Planctomycetia bacterium]
MILFRNATLALGDRPVVEGVSFEALAGRSVAVIGRTGAGKTSLLAAAATALPLDAGDITVHGHSVRREAAAVRRLVGYVPARPPAWPPCRIAEFLELAASSAGLQGKPLRTAVAKALDLAGLAGRATDPIDVLPDGSGRRLLLARALLHDPQVILLDDPFNALDPADRAGVEALVSDAHLMGRTVLAAIDDAVVPPCFTDLVVLQAGRVATTGSCAIETFAAGRRFTFRITCRGRADDAAAVMHGLADDARAVDLDHAEATIDPGVTPAARLVATVVAAGIPIDAAGFHPAWTAQLLE